MRSGLALICGFATKSCCGLQCVKNRQHTINGCIGCSVSKESSLLVYVLQTVAGRRLYLWPLCCISKGVKMQWQLCTVELLVCQHGNHRLNSKKPRPIGFKVWRVQLSFICAQQTFSSSQANWSVQTLCEALSVD